jgi:uncharacterized protein (DUF1330 family)
MKTNHKLVLALLAGVAIGVTGATVIHAQQVKSPPVYVISEVEVTDPVTFQKYAEKAPATIAASGGHFLVRGGKTEAYEGDPPKRIVVIAFDSAEQARGWYYSPAYEAIKPIRHSSAKTRGFTVEGVAPQRRPPRSVGELSLSVSGRPSVAYADVKLTTFIVATS